MKTYSTELDQEVNVMLEPAVAYQTYGNRKKVTYDELLKDKTLLISAIRAGVSYQMFNLIQQQSPFSETDWANFLDISTKSLQRYSHDASHHFKPIHSEKILEIAEVTQAGLEVFGDMEKLKNWLNTPNFALGKMLPIELIKDSYGKEMVLSELVRIAHGILV